MKEKRLGDIKKLSKNKAKFEFYLQRGLNKLVEIDTRHLMLLHERIVFFESGQNAVHSSSYEKVILVSSFSYYLI